VQGASTRGTVTTKPIKFDLEIMNAFDTLTPQNRKELNDLTETLIKKFSSEIPMFEKSITGFSLEEPMDEHSYHFINVPLLLRLALLDLCILFKYYSNSTSETDQNLFARLICGQLYEFTEDVPRLFGKKYRILLLDLPEADKWTSELNSVIKTFIERSNKYKDKLKTIRHNISHHRDVDGVLQVKLIEQLDLKFVTDAYMDLTEWFTIYFTKLENEMIKTASKS
jgi:hypothetical protein